MYFAGLVSVLRVRASELSVCLMDSYSFVIVHDVFNSIRSP